MKKIQKKENDCTGVRTQDVSTVKALLLAGSTILLLLVANMLGSLPFDLLGTMDWFRRIVPSMLIRFLRSLLTIGAAYLLFKAVIEKVCHSSVKKFRLAGTKLDLPVLLAGIALPFLVIASYALINGGIEIDTQHWHAVLKGLAISAIASLSAGITEEIAFRGYLLALLEKKWGFAGAVSASSLFFALVHIPSMSRTDPLSLLLLLTGATAVGILLALMAKLTGSVWTSAFVHFFWNVLIARGTFSVTGTASPLLVSKLHSRSFLLTGGGFGIEASLISISGYFLIILACLCIMKKRKELKGAL